MARPAFEGKACQQVLGLLWQVFPIVLLANGFTLVPARMLIVKILHIENTPLIAISIFLICVVSEVIAIKIIKRIPYAKTMVGM